MKDTERALLPLFGIPLGVKDIFDVAGMPTEGNCPARKGIIASDDATVVERLRAAGAVVVGKTQTTELALFDPPKTRNPWDLERTPGGSSSGSAAAVASGMCVIALGSQVGGSTLRPAAYNGIVGLKARFGRVSKHGLLKLSDEHDHVGIFAPDVAGAALVLDLVAGPDRLDPTMLESPPPRWARPPAGWRPKVAVAPPQLLEPVEAEARLSYSGSLEQLDRAGAVLEEIALPEEFEEISELAQVLLKAGAAAQYRELCARAGESVGADVRRTVEAGLAISAVEYITVLRRQRELRVAISESLSHVDALLTPAAPGPAPKGILTGSPVMQIPWSMLGFPTVSVPSATNSDGLPLALQVISAPTREVDAISVAWWCEAALGRLPLPVG